MSLLNSPSTAWELALEAYLISLPSKQRATFLSSTTAEECIALVSAAKDGRKRLGLTKFLDVLRPLIEPLKIFESAIDIIVQTNGTFCSPIWGPIRIVLTLADDHLKSVEKLAKILERIVALLPRAQTYEQLFASNEHAKRAIGTLYADFIDFCTRAVKYHSLPYYQFIRHNFNKEFEEVWERIQYDSQQMDWAANATGMKEMRTFQETTGNAWRYKDGSLRLMFKMTSSSIDSSAPIKILFTSCNEAEIVKSFSGHPSLQLNSDLTQNSVEFYVQKRLSDWTALANHELKGAISKKINHEAKGLWLYAKLMIDAVTELPTVSAI
ncbi:MAG: hypothetical protein MMC33_007574 [Icmadophila ericetorum]|nr:hypothetical protein [Icmadophila ericetorum]